jgi:hypothetical protein
MGPLSRTLNLEESPLAQEHLQTSLERAGQPLSRREWQAEAIVGGAMLAAAVALFVAAPDQRPLDAADAVLLTLAFALASRVEFDVVGFYTIPSQIVLVPMLFALPPSAVPLLAAAGLTLAKLPDVLTGRRPASRAAMAPSDAWFTLGPALVLTVAGAPDASSAAVPR